MTVEVFGLRLARLHLNEHGSRYVSDRWSSQIDGRGGGGVHGGHCSGSSLMEWCVMHSGVVPATLRLSQQEALLSRFPWWKQRLACVVLTIHQGLREWLVVSLRQQ